MKKKQNGFTLIEVIVVIAVVAILAAILTPTIAKQIQDSRISRTKNETLVIGAAIADLKKDTGWWPYTHTNGPAGGVDRILGDPTTVPTGAATGHGAGAANWGTIGTTKPIYDYLYYNNPDDDTGSTGQNQANQDYPTTGEFKWNGPYIKDKLLKDPWGRSYVVNARYFPGNTQYGGTNRHHVYVLSAGPDHLWSTPFANGTAEEEITGDDIGFRICVRK